MDLNAPLNFSKYHGLGNNFIFVDNRDSQYNLSSPSVIRNLCDHQTGIGADGLVEIQSCENAQHKSCLFEFIYHCQDGQMGAFCGNGGRCSVKFAVQLGLASLDEDVTFCGYDGQHVGRVDSSTGLVHLKMRDIAGDIAEIDENTYQIYTGSYTLVTYVVNLDDVNVQRDGDEARNIYKTHFDKHFCKMYVQRLPSDGSIKMRSYECGVNGETPACGTGALGAALVTECRRQRYKGQTSMKTDVHVRLGKITITAKRMGPKEFTDVYMTGPATHVFDGMINCLNVQRKKLLSRSTMPILEQ